MSYQANTPNVHVVQIANSWHLTSSVAVFREY